MLVRRARTAPETLGIFIFMENEVWKDVIGYEGLYQVSNFGRIRSKKGILKQGINKKGYPYINIRDKYGKQKQMETHRIIALTFLPNPFNKAQVDHIDANKTNNNVNNLRWTTPKENSNNINSLKKLRAIMKDKDFLRKRWVARKERGGKTAPKNIYMYDKSGTFIRKFESISEAASCFNGCNATISIAIDSKTRTAYGYKWYSKRQ